MNFNTIVFTRALGALVFFAMLTSCNQSDAPAAKTSAESVATSTSSAPEKPAQQPAAPAQTQLAASAQTQPAASALKQPAASAQPQPADVSNPSQQQTVLVKMASIDGVAANEEFTRNVQVIQSQRQEIVKLNASTNEAAAGSDARKALQSQLDAAVKKLETDNETMAKSYGYSIMRNYVRVPENSQIFVVLTEEEIAKQPAPTDGNAPSKTLKVCSLNDAQANQSFQDTVQKLQQMRQLAITAKDALDKATDASDKAYKQGQFDQLLKQLNEANTEANKAYAFNLNRQYVMSIEKSTLYVQASPEEAAAAEKANAGADAKKSDTPK